MYHLYEIVLESDDLWIKFQASCSSSEQALVFLEHRLGGEHPEPPVPVYPYMSFEIPTKLSQRVGEIANWESVKDSFPDDWDDHEFRLAEGPYPWCESLSDECDCHGRKGRLDAVFCSEFGLLSETSKRTGKSPNVRHSEYLKWLRERLVDSQATSRKGSPPDVEAPTEPSEQDGLYCQVEGRYHSFSEQVKLRAEASVAATRRSLETWSENDRRVVLSNLRGLSVHWLRTFQFQECADRLVRGRADVPAVLYKYIPKKLIGKGAPNSLRATQLLALNDDMECNIITMRGRETDALDFIALVQSRLKECLGADVAEQELMERALRFGDLRLSTFIQDYLNPLVGVVSLSTDVSVPTMWTHYALNTGIVVGYDTEVLRNFGFDLRKVSYTEIAPVYEPTRSDVIQLQFADRERIEKETRAGRTRSAVPVLGTVGLTELGAGWQDLSRLLFVKGPSWEYEKEVRLLVDLQEARETGEIDDNGWPVKVIDVPPEAVKEIYGGVRTSDADLARVAELARGDDKRGLFVGHVSSHAFRIQKTGGVRH
ncbi:MAG: DUF2971 domain-containing protein [Dehalococcoidia bacterium]|nr:DUF2971 domain-containing protein [Dehalococcoidia bacterium]MYA52912.1 DUF2971 domain-containing protein [Dehalococcoidia bacterium]